MGDGLRKVGRGHTFREGPRVRPAYQRKARELTH